MRQMVQSPQHSALDPAHKRWSTPVQTQEIADFTATYMPWVKTAARQTDEEGCQDLLKVPVDVDLQIEQSTQFK